MGNAKKRSGSVASMLPVLLACSFTASFGQSMMNVALPELVEATHASDNAEATKTLDNLIDGQRLRDIADLPLDLAI